MLRRLPSPAIAISMIALLVALGGTAYAAATINGSKIKIRTIPGNRLQNHTLTGTQINADKLGTVPKAALATRADSLPPLHWIPLSLENGWVNDNPIGNVRTPAYAVDAQGIVYFRGTIWRDRKPGSNDLATTLPAAIRPSDEVSLPADELGGATGQINIFPNGAMHVEDDPDHTGAAATFTSLDGLTYPLG